MENQREKFTRTLRVFVATDGKGMGDEYNYADYQGNRGDKELALAIAAYLEEHGDMVSTLGVNWFNYLPKIMHKMLIEFREEPRYAALRADYEQEGVGKIPHPTDCHVDPQWRALSCNSIARMCGYFSTNFHGGPWVKQRLEELFGAQEQLVQAAWWRFVDLAYVPLLKRIKDESHRGNAGDFGTTHLMTWAGIGRVMLTFRRGDTETTFIADDSDSQGLRSGSNFSTTPYQQRIAMIEDVIANWDLDKLIPDSNVSFGGDT